MTANGASTGRLQRQRRSVEPTEWNSLEDLALCNGKVEPKWTALAAGGLSASGVFFAPNASVTISGGSDSLNPLNAQFVSRTLSLTGNATLYLRPSPYDAVTIPLAPSFGSGAPSGPTLAPPRKQWPKGERGLLPCVVD